MDTIWRKPILVGGIGLSLTLWLADTLNHSVGELGEWSFLGLLAGGAGWWLMKSRSPAPTIDLTPLKSKLNQALVEKAIGHTATTIELLATEAPEQLAHHQLKERLASLQSEMGRQDLQIGIIGEKAVGKTAIREFLTTNWLPKQSAQIGFSESNLAVLGEPSRTIANISSESTNSAVLTLGLDGATTGEIYALADILLLVVNGDITDSEYQILAKLAPEHFILLVCNKIDQYLPDQQDLILQKLKERTADILPSENVLGIASVPSAIKVKKYQTDGTLQEWVEKPAAKMENLTAKIQQMITEERQQLVWATTIRKAKALQQEAKLLLNQVRRDRSLPTIEQYQWITGAATLANPVPALDLLANAAISTQMIVDLGAVYQQKISLEQAKIIVTTLATQMVKLGLVELATQSITNLLKTNAITYVAGGVIQGISAAYFTRIAGLTMIEYLENQPVPLSLNDDRNFGLNLGKYLEKVAKLNQQADFFSSFVKQVTNHLPLSATVPNQAS